jgi:dTMP kinase
MSRKKDWRYSTSGRETLDRLIVFEGIDGAGTTTQARLLVDRLRSVGMSVWGTSEPTDNSIGNLLRAVLGGDVALTPETVAYLYAADRWEHVFGDGGIVDHHESGEIVVCDRYFYSSLVYQTVQCDPDLVRRLNDPFPRPACLIFVDLDVESGTKRLASRTRKEIFETPELQMRVRENYLRELRSVSETTSAIMVSGSDSEAEVHRNIWERLERTSILKP